MKKLTVEELTRLNKLIDNVIMDIQDKKSGMSDSEREYFVRELKESISYL